MNDVVLNKIQSIQRCVARVREEYADDPEGFETDFTRQDAAVLSLLRACEQTIDLANHVVKLKQFGVPASSGDSFNLLARHNVIDTGLSEKLKMMVHFRHTVIHAYQQADLEILKKAVASGVNDLIDFGDQVRNFLLRDEK